MGTFTNNRRLIEAFPDATYCASGLDAGKWITEKYKFNFDAGFYTEISSGRSTFVNGAKAWNKTINDLKNISEQTLEPDPIVKDSLR